METRQPTAVKSYDPDLRYPIDAQEAKQKSVQSCFGKAWDITTKECGSCADKDVCSIIMRGTIDTVAKNAATERGIIYLDETMFHRLTDDKVMEFCKAEERSTQDLVNFVSETANTSDATAVVAWIKRFITEKKLIYTKEGKVWLR